MLSKTDRPYQRDRDFEPVIDLYLQCQNAGYVDMEFRSIELRVKLSDPEFDTERFTRVIKAADGTLEAFALLWGGHTVGMLIDPASRGKIEDRVLAWAAGQARETKRPSGKAPVLRVLCRSDDAFWCELLEQRGFRVSHDELRMGKPLHGPIPEAALPQHFAIRHLAGEHELEEWVALYNSAFASAETPAQTTMHRWLGRMRDQDYVPELNLIVTDPEGRMAAMCMCSSGSIEAGQAGILEGRTEPIATRADCRRQGLARAVILEGCRLLSERGLTSATLTTASDNLSAHRLYESLGYRHLYRGLWYSREI